MRLLKILFCVQFIFSFVACSSYQPAFSYADLPVNIHIVNTRDYIEITPYKVKYDLGVMFYPGGLIEPEAYIELFARLSLTGYKTVIIKMPWNLAVYSPGKGLKFIRNFEGITSWVIAGHSLGGAMALSTAKKNSSIFKGIILMGAYATRQFSFAQTDFPVLCLYGSDDGIATPVEIEKGRPYLPADTRYVVIEGGNHSGFGSYGLQKGDNPARISEAEQHRIIIQAIEKFLTSL